MTKHEPLSAFTKADDASLKLKAERLGLKLVYGEPEQNTAALWLDENGLSLKGEGLSICADFARMLPRIKQSNLNRELLVKAAKRKSFVSAPVAIDATAGFGEDAFLLAAAGFYVKLYENNPQVAALLKDALIRAEEVSELKKVTDRMQLFTEDSIKALGALEAPIDLIYLDPMFPLRQKSALVKKKFQLLHLIEQPCNDEEDLIKAAIASHPKKIVIKRPAKGAYLGEVKPSYSLNGDGIRFDCIVFS